MIDSENTIYINSKPLNTLIPGMSTDPYSARARAKSTGKSKEYFKQLYTQLLPYYVDLRDGNKDSTKILHDFGNNPQECGKVINLLMGLGQCHVLDDWKQVGIQRERKTRRCFSVSVYVTLVTRRSTRV